MLRIYTYDTLISREKRTATLPFISFPLISLLLLYSFFFHFFIFPQIFSLHYQNILTLKRERYAFRGLMVQARFFFTTREKKAV